MKQEKFQEGKIVYCYYYYYYYKPFTQRNWKHELALGPTVQGGPGYLCCLANIWLYDFTVHGDDKNEFSLFLAIAL